MICKKCKINKDLDEFPKHKQCKNGIEKSCKDCKYKNALKWTYNNPDKRKKSIDKFSNSEKALKYRDSYYKQNKEIIINKVKEYTLNNKEKVYKRQKNYRLNNRDKIRKNQKEYYKKHPWIKIWRTTLNSSLQRMKVLKTERTFKLLGYSSKELKQHLESKFNNNMNWNNYGTYWVVDHIKPISKFNKNSCVKEVCALNNLQPLEKIKNLQKYNKYE